LQLLEDHCFNNLNVLILFKTKMINIFALMKNVQYDNFEKTMLRIFLDWCKWLKIRLIIKSSFHIYFLTCSSTRYQYRDSTQILNINLVTRLDIDLESNQNSNFQLNSSSNRKFRVQWKEILITTSRSFSSRVSIFRIHENTDYY